MTPENKLKIRLEQIFAFVMRRFREMYKNKMVLFWAFLWPVFWYLLITYLVVLPQTSPEFAGAIKATNAISFGIFGALSVTLVVFAADFAHDRKKKRYRKFRSMDLPPTCDLAGRFLSGSTLGVLSFFSVILVGWIDGAGFALRSVYSIPIIVGGLFLLGFIGMSMALLISSFLEDPRYSNSIALSLLMVLFFITGYNGIQPSFFPANNKGIINLLPNSLVGRLEIYHLTDINFGEAGLTPPVVPSGPKYLILLSVYFVFFIILALVLMKVQVYEGGD